jgi:hypothetical protein
MSITLRKNTACNQTSAAAGQPAGFLILLHPADFPITH